MGKKKGGCLSQRSKGKPDKLPCGKRKKAVGGVYEFVI